MNTPGGNNVTTAEHAISMLLALARSIPQATASMKAGKWEKSKFTGSEVSNKTLGIVGIGNIGRLVAERAQGLKMKVIAYDPFITAGEGAASSGSSWSTLDELLAARRLRLHPHAAAARDAQPDRRRGARQDEADGAADQLRPRRHRRRGRAGRGAAQQASSPAPRSTSSSRSRRRADHPLLQLDNVICTPHLGAATAEAQVNVVVAIAEQIVDFLVHNVIRSAVNMPSISAEQLEVLRPVPDARRAARQPAGAAARRGAAARSTVEYAGDVAELRRPAGHRRRAQGLARPAARDQRGQLRQRPRAGASERGIKVVESKTSAAEGLHQLDHRARAHGAARPARSAGAVFGRDVIRLVRINGFFLEAVPEGFILMLNNRDVPGVVGNVGMLLGEAKINIAGLQLGRETRRRHGALAGPRRRAHSARRCWRGCASCPTSCRPIMLEL